MYIEVGLAPSSGPREAPDHIALELELLYYLTHQLITKNEQRYRRLRDEFFNEHLLRWTPALVSAVLQANTLDFYNSLALLLKNLCSERLGKVSRL